MERCFRSSSLLMGVLGESCGVLWPLIGRTFPSSTLQQNSSALIYLFSVPQTCSAGFKYLDHRAWPRISHSVGPCIVVHAHLAQLLWETVLGIAGGEEKAVGA